MSRCPHKNLHLIPQTATRLRCRHCHLTIKPEELGDDCCPECYDASGEQRYDFEEVAEGTVTRYRCEDCNIVIECDAKDDAS